MGCKDARRSWGCTVPLCSSPTPVDLAGKRNLEGGKSGYTASEYRSPPPITLPEGSPQAIPYPTPYSRGIRLSQLPRKPGCAVVAMAVGLLASGEAVALPFPAAIAMAKLG